MRPSPVAAFQSPKRERACRQGRERQRRDGGPSVQPDKRAGLLLLFGQLPPRPHCQNTHHQPDPQAGGGGWRGRLTLANHESQSFQSCGHQDQRDRKVKKERMKPPDEYLKTGH